MPQILLQLAGHSTAQTHSGRYVELYHVTLKDVNIVRQAKVRHRILRKYLKPIMQLEGISMPLPRKFTMKGSCNEEVIHERVRCFRKIFVTLSAIDLTDKAIASLHSMLDEAGSELQKLQCPSIDNNDERHHRSLPDEYSNSADSSTDDHERSTSSMRLNCSASFSRPDDEENNTEAKPELNPILIAPKRKRSEHSVKLSKAPSKEKLFAPSTLRREVPSRRDYECSEEDAVFIDNLAQQMLSNLKQPIPPSPPRQIPFRKAQTEPWLPIEEHTIVRDRAMDRLAEWTSQLRCVETVDESGCDVIKNICSSHFPTLFEEEESKVNELSEPSVYQASFQKLQINQKLMGYMDAPRGTKKSPMRRAGTY